MYDKKSHSNTEWLKNIALKWNLSWQSTNNHAFKTGVEYIQNSIKNNPVALVYQDENDPDLFSFPYDSLNGQFVFGNVEMEYLPDSLKTKDDYKKYPVEFSAFLQDKMEFDLMTINAGLRFDYFDANTVYPTQMRNPGNQLNYYQYDENGDVLLDESGGGLLDSTHMSSYLEAGPKYKNDSPIYSELYLAKARLAYRKSDLETAISLSQQNVVSRRIKHYYPRRKL